jgi:hypothetical protein
MMDLWNVDYMAPDSMEESMVNIVLPILDKAVVNNLQEYLLREHSMYYIVVLFHKDIQACPCQSILKYQILFYWGIWYINNIGTSKQ